MPDTSPLNAVVAEQHRRTSQSSPIEMLTLKPQAHSELFAAAGGTVIVFLAKQGSGFKDGFKKAAAEGSVALQSYLKPTAAQYRKGSAPLTLEGMAKAMVREPVFADIRYAGERLASGVFVPKGRNASSFVLPWNGGDLLKDLTLVEYSKDASAAGFETIAVKVTPVLSAAESAALKAVPKTQWGKNLGALADCETTYWAVAFVTAGLVGIAVLAATAAVVARLKEVHLSDDAIAKAGPEVSARTLVDLRRKAIAAKQFS